MQQPDEYQQRGGDAVKGVSATDAALLALARLMGRMAAQDHMAASAAGTDMSDDQDTTL